MENEETKVDEKLKSAFNEGYLLGLNKSDLAAVLKKHYSKVEYDSISEIVMLYSGLDKGIEAKERIRGIKDNLDGLSEIRKSAEQEWDLSQDREY